MDWGPPGSSFVSLLYLLTTPTRQRYNSLSGNQSIYVLFCPAPRIFTAALPREPNPQPRVLKMCLLMLCSKLSSTFKGPRAAKTIKEATH